MSDHDKIRSVFEEWSEEDRMAWGSRRQGLLDSGVDVQDAEVAAYEDVAAWREGRGPQAGAERAA